MFPTMKKDRRLESGMWTKYHQCLVMDISVDKLFKTLLSQHFLLVGYVPATAFIKMKAEVAKEHITIQN